MEASLIEVGIVNEHEGHKHSNIKNESGNCYLCGKFFTERSELLCAGLCEFCRKKFNVT